MEVFPKMWEKGPSHDLPNALYNIELGRLGVLHGPEYRVVQAFRFTFRGENMMFRFSWIAATVVAAALWTSSVNTAEAGGYGCCCPPPPIEATLCVSPPCSCCSQAVTVCVPGCCTEAPTVCWRTGIFGRQIGTYTWACCGHTVKVVVNKHGNLKVRG